MHGERREDTTPSAWHGCFWPAESVSVPRVYLGMATLKKRSSLREVQGLHH